MQHCHPADATVDDTLERVGSLAKGDMSEVSNANASPLYTGARDARSDAAASSGQPGRRRLHQPRSGRQRSPP
eukprot:1775594-Prymnesium_polylepis.1